MTAAEPRVFVFPADHGACGEYRMRLPAAALLAQGADVQVHESEAGVLKASYARSPVTGEKKTIGVEPLDCDVVVLQRVATRELAEAIPFIQAQGIAVVVEIDDLCSSIPSDNISNPGWNPALHPDHNYRHLAYACRIADMVTCTTRVLADKYGHGGRVRILPNCIPQSFLSVDVSRPGTTLGWSGTVGSHRGDLKVIRGVPAKAIAGTDWDFKVVGDERALRLLGTEGTATGWLDHRDGSYARAVAQFEIGLGPLADNPFNKAKSGLRLLQHGALKTAWVATETQENRRFKGCGILLPGKGGWERAITKLIGSPDLRDELAGRGHELAQDWTFEERCGEWMDAWAVAAANCRGRMLP